VTFAHLIAKQVGDGKNLRHTMHECNSVTFHPGDRNRLFEQPPRLGILLPEVMDSAKLKECVLSVATRLDLINISEDGVLICNNIRFQALVKVLLKVRSKAIRRLNFVADEHALFKPMLSVSSMLIVSGRRPHFSSGAV
jgi:hypothetical protein